MLKSPRMPGPLTILMVSLFLVLLCLAVYYYRESVRAKRPANRQPGKVDRFFRASVENSRGIIWLLDKNLRILFRSAFASKASGWTDEEIPYVPMDRIHPDWVETVKAVYAEALASPGRVLPLEFKMLHKKGWYICLEGTVTNLLEDPAVEGIVVNLHDITTRKRAEEKLLGRSRLYYFLSKMNQAIVKAGDERKLFGDACQIAVVAGKFRMAWIGRIDESGERVVPVCHAGDERDYLSTVRIVLTEGTPEGMGPGGRALRDGCYYVCNDIETAQEMAPWREAALARNYRSSIGLPLRRGSKIFGLFSLYADRKDFFDAQEIGLLESLAADLSYALGLFEQRALRMKMEEALNRINDGVISVDKEWRYTYLNDAALALHPLGREGTLGKSVWDVHPQLQDMIFWDKYHEAMERRKVVEFEVYYEEVGIWFSIRAYPSEDGLTIYYKDITEQKKSELQLKESEERYRLAQEIGRMGHWELDMQRNVLLWSDEIYRMFDIRKEEFENSWDVFLQLIHPEDKAGFLRAREQALKRMAKLDYILRIIRRDGEVRYEHVLGEVRNLRYWAGTVQDITDQVLATDQLRELAAHLQDVREEERIEIARDIHDDLGQQLTAVKIALYRLSKQVSADAAVEEGFRGVIEMIGKGIESIRRISTQLRPVILHDLGLVEAMKWQIEEFEKRFGIPVKAWFNGAAQEIEPKIVMNVFRMFQETLTNVARHSGATQVEVRFEADGERIALEVADNGKGLNTEEIKTKRTLGLLGMRERALMIGGEFEIEGQPGKGTRIRIKVPIDKTTDAYADINS
jgi:PAS domain S-box-containing protein